MSVAGKKKGRRRLLGEINVVPYIDVMLVLLIIFMVTAPLVTEGVKVNLPQASAKALSNNDNPTNVILTVDAKGRYFLNIGAHQDRPLKPQAMEARVAAVLKHNRNVRVLVRGDRDVSYKHVLSGMTLLQSAGAPTVGLITHPDNASQTRRAH